MRPVYPGFTDTREYTVAFDGQSYLVVVGTVSEGMLKGEMGVATINDRPTWRTANFIRESVMLCAMRQHKSATEMRRPFAPDFRMGPGLRTPFPIHLMNAGLPLVRSYPGYSELREGFVDNARIPGLYLEGVYLASMGGEPYAVWN